MAVQIYNIWIICVMITTYISWPTHGTKWPFFCEDSIRYCCKLILATNLLLFWLSLSHFVIS